MWCVMTFGEVWPEQPRDELDAAITIDETLQPGP